MCKCMYMVCANACTWNITKMVKDVVHSCSRTCTCSSITTYVCRTLLPSALVQGIDCAWILVWVSMYVCMYVHMSVTHWNAIIPYACAYHLRVWCPLPYHCCVHGTRPHVQCKALGCNGKYPNKFWRAQQCSSTKTEGRRIGWLTGKKRLKELKTVNESRVPVYVSQLSGS